MSGMIDDTPNPPMNKYLVTVSCLVDAEDPVQAQLSVVSGSYSGPPVSMSAEIVEEIGVKSEQS